MTNRSRLAACAISLILLGIAWAANAGPALGYAHINTFEVTPTTTQAGGHPDVEIRQTFDNRQLNEGGAPESSNPACGCQDVFELKNEFPTGFIGNTNAVPRCSLLALSQRACPVESQVGVAGALFNGQQPIFNMEPHPGEPGLLGFFAPLINFPIFIELAGRTDSDYGLNGRTTGIFHILPIGFVVLHLWGVPGDSIHDANRFPPPQTGFCFAPYPESCPGQPASTPFNGSVAPFLENPTSCNSTLEMGLSLLYYDFTALHASTGWPETTGCDQLTFNPSLTAKPTTTQADTATGLDVDLKVPQTQSATTPSPSEIRATNVTLPPGFSINPNAADGKAVCSNAEASFGTLDAANCPENAKVGTLTIDSSALPGPIDGAIYLGTPEPGNPYRIIVAADGFSTHVKLAGSIHADPVTGRLVASFVNLPQSPLQEFTLHFFGSERGLLATPTKCGKYSVESEFVPWDEVLPIQTSTSFMTIDSGPNGHPCPGTVRPFSPQVGSGSPDSTAGAHSPFAFKLDREDGDQNLSGLTVHTPPGFTATLAGVSYCPDSALALLSDRSYSGVAEQQSSACPANSLVGTATAGTGAGSKPFYAPGKVYLAGPYKGAPLSLAVVIPAVQGPYDLGNVMVRAAIHVDPVTAQVTAVTDPLPQILEGIPLRARSILINLSRPNFTLNPTNCSPFDVDSKIFGDEGGFADLSTNFQVANCAVLGFAPKLAFRLGGSTKRTGHPVLHATLTTSPGDANIADTVVTMPHGELLDNAHIGTVCTRVAFNEHNCPTDSDYGHATAFSPLLDRPLEGEVYLRSSRHELPDLVADLRGQVNLEVAGRIDAVKGGRLRASFESVPDVPVSKFVLDLKGGSKGLLQSSEDLCESLPKALVRMTGQNGATITQQAPLNPPCGKARSKRHHSRHARRAGKAG